jgi:prepilin-type N-terminal cleavage/methylation domain-containing protein/prepilin-type processing-associated H-X9-DG protein
MNRPEHVPVSAPRAISCTAFTLIELLVVVAVVGVLAGLLLPSLARAKTQAKASFCQSNNRQLMIACLMYCDDNSGFFPYNLAGAAVHTNINWASDLLDWETNSDDTNTALLTGAALGPYAAQSASVFRCPSDNVASPLQASLGWPNRARSYSMNASIGDAGEITESGVNTNNPDYVQFFKVTSVPQTAQIFVFIEEHPDTIYDGYFLNKAYSWQWTRLPASYHLQCANISFVDGHAELHHWQDSDTTPPSVPDGAAGVILTNLPQAQRGDLTWVVTHMSVKGD